MGIPRLKWLAHRRAATTTTALVVALTSVGAALGASATAAVAESAAPAVEMAQRQAATLTLSRNSVVPEAALKARGKVPADSSRRVILQAKKGAAWKRVASSYTNARGRYSFRVEAPETPGQVRLRVHAPRDRGYDTVLPAVTTRTVTLTVIDPRGSRTNPYELGEQFRIGDWTVVVHHTDYDAWPEMDPELADPPPSGWNFVTVSATFGYHGHRASSPDDDLFFDFLAADHRVYDRSSGGDWCVGVDPDVTDLDDMYAGAVVTANDCAIVPTALAEGGLWRIGGYMVDDYLFVRAG